MLPTRLFFTIIGVAWTQVKSTDGYNYSCADFMEGTHKNPLDDGYYIIRLNASYYDSTTVYCHFNYTSNYAWTLIESFSLYYASTPRYYAFYESYAYLEDYVSTYRNSRYRMGSTWMRSIYKSMLSHNDNGEINPRKMMSTCNFDTSLDEDYLIINLDDNELQYNPLYDYWSSYTCLKMESVNIRGYQCDNENVYAYNSGSHFFIDAYYSDYCDCYPWESTSSSSEDNFGYYYSSYQNTGFSCTASSSSTTNWWLGRYVPQTYETIEFELESDFNLFRNVTCDDITKSYAYYEISLDDCLYQCKWDYYYNTNNKTCRFALYLESHKGDDDQKCFLFNEWCKFGESHSEYDELVFAFDFELVSYSYPRDWTDKYNDDCNDYIEHEWCVDGDATEPYHKFHDLRDTSNYDKTAIDVCGECGGGLSQYNVTNMSLSLGIPLYNDSKSIIEDNEQLLCYLDFETVKESINDSISSYKIESFDKPILYSICTQYFRKLGQFYNNSDNEVLYNQTALFDCNVFSLRESDKISQVNISLCDLDDVNNNNNINDLTNFVFAIGLNDFGNYGELMGGVNGTVGSVGAAFNVYLSSLWVDFDAVEYLSNSYDIISSNVPYDECNKDIFDTNINHLSAVVLPCNMKNHEAVSWLEPGSTEVDLSDYDVGPIIKYSCADWMYESLGYTIEYENGYYEIMNFYDSYTNNTVYCYFDYDEQYAYTLIESFSYDNSYYTEYYAFYESYSINQANPWWYIDSLYRMDLYSMWSIFLGMEQSSSNQNNYPNYDRKLVSTCNFDMSFVKDYLILNLDDNKLEDYNPLYDYWSTYTKECIRAEKVNIRGYGCNNQDVHIINTGNHLHIDSYEDDCDCQPWENTATYGEDNFGYYYYSNSYFSCSATSTSTTNWWLARYVPDYYNNNDITDSDSNDNNKSNKNNNEGNGHSDGAVIGAAFGCFFAGLLIAGGYLWWKRKNNGQNREHSAANVVNRNGVRSLSPRIGGNNPNVATRPYANGGEDLGLCTICQDNVLTREEGKPLITLSCQHVFHEQCWNDFKASNNNGPRNVTCPNCRHNPYR